MINQIINFSIRNKLIVILFTLTIAAFGIFAVVKIPVGAVPDITNNQVQVITVSTSLSTQDVEQFITYPVELEMANLPGVEEIRSISKFGLSVVTIVFDEKLGTYLPRQLIAEKIKSAAANIPEGYGTPEMGPISTGLGEVYQYILDVRPGYKGKYSITELRTIQDWIAKRQLSGIPGVVEVNTWGGFLKQYEIAIDPKQLNNYNISLLEIYDAVVKNNGVAGGAYIEKNDESFFIRGDGMVKSIEDIEHIVVKTINGTPLLVGNIAQVRLGYANRYGAITANGEGEKVMGQIMMLKDADSKQVIREIKQRVEEVQKSLPEGVFINPIVERSELISKTTLTVVENLLLGCLIVMLTVILILGNMRSALVIASIIPLSLLFTISAMYILGIDANLMSLGALDFGIIIDGAVIVVEYIALRITDRKADLEVLQGDKKRLLFDKISYEGASKMISSAIFGQLIILIVLIPVFVLSGVEGKMFRPMALSFSFAMVGAMILGLTWIPVAAAMFLKPEKENKKNIATRIMNLAHRSYDPVIKWAYDHKLAIIGMALASLVITGVIYNRMGGEFVPTLDEGDFVIQPVLKTGTSLTKTIDLTTQMEKILIENFPEVDQIVCRIGAAEVPTDPMSMEEIDMIIKLNPIKTWENAKNKEELAEKFKDALMVIPGIDYEFTQPIEMRFNELITGVTSDIAIKVFGEDLDYLNQKAFEIKNLIEDIPGAADVVIDKTAGLPQISVSYNRSRIAMYGLNVEELNMQLSAAFGGLIAGNVFEGEKRFDIAIRYNELFRNDIEYVKQLPVALPNGGMTNLQELAEVFYTYGPAKISRENTHRLVTVSVNVRGSDLESVISEIQQRVETNINFEPGYYVSYGGQFENLENAMRRLKYAVPVALLLIFVFLHFAFKSFKDAALIFTSVPLSIVGGVFLLWLRDMPFSISAGIGFIALFGVAVLNGIILIEHLKELMDEGITDLRVLVIRATHERLRPVLLTAASTAVGFLPMAISTSAGSEVQRPLATVVIGGLITSTMLTMIMLPILYALINSNKPFRWFKKNKAIVTAVLFLVLIFPKPVKAQQEPEYIEISIEDAVELTKKNNPQIKNAQLSVDAAQKLKKGALNLGPTEFIYQKGQLNSSLIDQSFEINQSLGSLLTHYQTVKYNGAQINLSKTESDLIERKIIAEARIAYFRWIYQINKLKINHDIATYYKEMVRIAQAKYEYGESNLLEQVRVETEYAAIKNELLKSNEELLLAENALKQIMNQDGCFIPSSDSLTLYWIDHPKNDSTAFTGKAITKYYEDLYVLESKKLKIEQSYLFPEISAGYFIQEIDNQPGFNGWSVGISVPLWFLPQQSKTQAAKIEREKAYNNLKFQKLNTGLEIENIIIQLDQLQNELIYFHENALIKAELLISTSKLQFDKEEIEYFEYIQSIKIAQDIKIEYLNTVFNYNKAAIELEYYIK